MSAFDAAMARIYANPALAVGAVWLPGGMSPGRAIRIIRKAPDDLTDYGSARIWSETLRVDVRVAEVATPAPGDAFVIEGERFTVQGEPVRDRERLIWTLELVQW